MAITFKNNYATPNAPDEKSFKHMQKVVLDLIKPSEACLVSVGMTQTKLERGGVTILLDFGVADIKNSADKLHPKLVQARQTLYSMVPYLAPQVGGAPLAQPTEKVAPPKAKSYSDMTDQEWMEHTAAKLFPGVVNLCKAEELYQPVLGTSNASIYKTCFIGPELKVACRIKGKSISFRVTTSADEAPKGDLLNVFSRLGDFSAHSNRITLHCSMGGHYDLEHAHEYRAVFGAYYAALKPWITSNFPAIGKLAEGVA